MRVRGGRCTNTGPHKSGKTNIERDIKLSTHTPLSINCQVAAGWTSHSFLNAACEPLCVRPRVSGLPSLRTPSPPAAATNCRLKRVVGSTQLQTITVTNAAERNFMMQLQTHGCVCACACTPPLERTEGWRP